MHKTVTADMIEDLAAGSAFLGTGGGGDPYLGSLLCREAIAQYGPVSLISPQDLKKSDNVYVAAIVGAPTVMIEKLISIRDQHKAVAALEDYTGQQASVIASAEIGGCNSMMPLAYAAMRGLPLLDGDGMGRAFPELQMTSFNIEGVSCTPMSLADEHDNRIIIEAQSAKKTELLTRPLAAEMGASICMSCYPMDGEEAARTVVPHTISAALDIGAAINRRDSAEKPPIERLLSALRRHDYYSNAYEIYRGKITNIERNTTRGWVLGECTISSLEKHDSRAKLVFQNENLTAYVDGELRCIVPDLITVVDMETANAITTERLSYGQRVAVIGCSAPKQINTAKARETVGPGCFGLEEDYLPISQLVGDQG
ncbi:DUF917 domain-containing protein [Parasphingorhabdus litoris]|uniref:DUF917 domain-containing protein n=1 Tax=Parasphingorhabdus litoris TaxID=394733 RepID=A0ABN1A6L3_9SPHN|nr:DUF917 domain-containing protein [Parasphingorhabdus litoris]